MGFDPSGAAYVATGGLPAGQLIFERAVTGNDPYFRAVVMDVIARSGDAGIVGWLVAQPDDKRLHPSERTRAVRQRGSNAIFGPSWRSTRSRRSISIARSSRFATAASSSRRRAANWRNHCCERWCPSGRRGHRFPGGSSADEASSAPRRRKEPVVSYGWRLRLRISAEAMSSRGDPASDRKISCRSSRSSSPSFAIEDVIRPTSLAPRVPASARHLFRSLCIPRL